MGPAAEAISVTREDFAIGACGASWMVSHCESPAIYAGPPGRLVLLQAGNEAQTPLLRQISCGFVRRLRRHAGRSSRDAAHFFYMQIAAVAHVITHMGVDAGLKHSELLLLASRSLTPTGLEIGRLESGFC